MVELHSDAITYDMFSPHEADYMTTTTTSDDGDGDGEDHTWTGQMLLRGDLSGFLCRMDGEYQKDKFHWTDLDRRYDFMYFTKAAYYLLDKPLVLDPQSSVVIPLEMVEKEAIMLYGLLHARFILTDAGCEVMKHKYLRKDFGICPRDECQQQAVLPIGTSDDPCEDSVKIYCPKCCDIYHPWKDNTDHLDGAFFGTGFPHHFFMLYPDLRPLPCSTRPLELVQPEEEEEELENTENQTTTTPAVSEIDESAGDTLFHSVELLDRMPTDHHDYYCQNHHDHSLRLRDTGMDTS